MNPKIVKCLFVLLVVICVIATLGIWSPKKILDMIQPMTTTITDKEFYDAFFAAQQKQQQSSSSLSSSSNNNNNTSALLLLRSNRNKKPSSSAAAAGVVVVDDVSTSSSPKRTEPEPIIIPKSSSSTTTKTSRKKAVIAYAVSITDFNKNKILYDNAAVLHKSIKLAHSSSSSHYDYHMVAFVHPDAATECQLGMEQLGYEVQVRDTPFNLSDIKNPALQESQSIGCCGVKEYLKLYSYTLMDYPIVVHLDLDTIVLKPMDDLFDLMLYQPQQELDDDNSNSNNKELLYNLRSKVPAMWIKDPNDFPNKIDFAFTRDYNMVDPPRRQPHQIGVQGGFLVIKPNITDFERLVELVVNDTDYVRGIGWGGRELMYGGYYGEATIQGLASYYYGAFEGKNRSLEINKCNYNTMCDDPMNTAIVKNRPDDVKLQCRTLEDECEDCRKTNLNGIYTAHFTVCGKPHWCRYIHNVKDDLCMKLFHQWHKVRRSIEDEWAKKYSPYYDPKLFQVTAADALSDPILVGLHNNTLGHCPKVGRSYIPLVYPSGFADSNSSSSSEILL